MVATPIQTGHGSTITFATSAFVGSIISIGGFEMSREVLDKTVLSSGAYREFLPGDVVDPGEFTIDFFYDLNSQPPILSGAELVTIKVPDSVTGIIGIGSPSIAGQAFCRSFSHPELVTDGLMRGQAVIKWAGGPIFTDGT